MSFKTIHTILRLILTDAYSTTEAYMLSAWQSAKTVYNQIERTRRAEPYDTTLRDSYTRSPGKSVKLGMILIDLEAAYRQFPVEFPNLSAYKTWDPHRKQWRWSTSPLLMFGATPSIYFFAIFAFAIVSVLSALNIVSSMYVDDIIIYVPVDSMELALKTVHLLFKFIGLPIAHDKTSFIKSFSDPAIGLGYLYHIHSHGHAISISLPQNKAREISQLLSKAIADLANKQLTFDLVDILAGNLVWASQLERYSLFRVYTNFLKTWTIKSFFHRAVATSAAKTLNVILRQIQSIFDVPPPVAVIADDDFSKPVFHIFSDASLENCNATFGAFLISTKDIKRATTFYYAKTVNIEGINDEDRKSLTIDIFETLAFITIINAAVNMLTGAHIFLHVDNSTSNYGIVKLTGKYSIRTSITTCLVSTLQKYHMKPVIAYIQSKKNIGDALTRTDEMFTAAISHFDAQSISIPDGPISTLVSRTKKADIPETRSILIRRNQVVVESCPESVATNKTSYMK